MTKILFILPPHLTFRDFISPASNARHIPKKDGRYYGDILTDMPLGILSLSAYVKKYATQPVEVRLVDFNIELNRLDGFTHDSFAQFFAHTLEHKLEGFTPDIIAISALFTPTFQNLLDLAACCRNLYPQAILTAGGSVPATLFLEIYRRGADFDGLCYGEGERPFLALVEAEDRKQVLESHGSWITRAKVLAAQSYSYDFVQDLDEIPFLDYDLLEINRYGANSTLNAYVSIKEERLDNAHLMTSRGCPFKCIFCASHKIHGREMRYYSMARVEEDILRLKNQYGTRILVFLDDHFMGDKARAMEILKLVKRMEIRAFFPNSLALYALDRPMLEALRAVGVEQLILAVESGSDRVLKHVMKKPHKLSMVQIVADHCREVGIYTNVNILIGLPGETKEDIEESRRFLKSIRANWFQILCASPLVGSEMYDICAEKNYLKDGYIGCDFKKAVVETEEFSAAYIQEMAYTINLELNFVENSDFRLGYYESALKGFENAIRVKHDHAIAHYFAGKCYEKLGNGARATALLDKAHQICRESPFWRQYFELFGLPLPADIEEAAAIPP